MKPLATYSFLPWLRQGIANTIATDDGDVNVKTRASVNVSLELVAEAVVAGPELKEPVTQDIALYGPGDIIGIDPRAIVRTDPQPWITNYESNYLAAIEFYDEDFPWRYSPMKPGAGGGQLRPWLALVVLDETEFKDGRNVHDRPLPYISVLDAKSLPPAGELWAWAHVHVNTGLGGNPGELVSPNMAEVLPRFESVLAADRDQAYARLMCPRRLADNTGYHAFLVPTFETGRRAGLTAKDAPVTDPPTFATASAWGASGAVELPVYHRWFFRTGSKGDFEYLVGLLKPRPVDTRVGTRDMDVQQPGSNIAGIDDPKLAGILRLGGALQVPEADFMGPQLELRQTYENWDQPYPTAFQSGLAKFINLPDDYATQQPEAANAAAMPGIPDNPDPLITAPLYGRWHALTQRLMTERDGTDVPYPSNWVHRLNLDPRFRVAAAFGANVVETNAEAYMNYAWEQIGDVLAANRAIRHLQLATVVSGRWYDDHLKPLADVNKERAFTLAAPVTGRVLYGGVTISHAQSVSLLPPVLTSTAIRRVLRPGGRLMRRLPFDAGITPGNLLGRINDGEVSAAPPKTTPPAIPTVDQAATAAQPPGVPIWILTLLATLPWLPLAVLLVAIVLILLLLALLSDGSGVAVAIAIGALLLLLFYLLLKWKKAGAPAQALGEAGQTPSSVGNLPTNPNFVIAEPGSTVRPQPGSSDSATATRFKAALLDWYTLLEVGKQAAKRPERKPFDFVAITGSLIEALDPRVTIPKRGLSRIAIPPWIRLQIGETFDEVMAYPKIDLPMYQPLKKISVELFLPNVNLVAANSITLIETNQKFIESYMVGLNHEFARKLLWRGYPTDQRGSYFRQFWDVRGVIDLEGLSHDPLKEKLYDIPELHRWPVASKLGNHNHRASPSEVGKEQAVLVIRGELLKKYPNAVIYAQHARWVLTNGKIDPQKARVLDDLTDAEEAKPPRAKIRMPLYEAKADPDIYFFGFDLNVPEAKGQSGKNPGDDPGWFFIIKERPGEPRFGLDVARDGKLKVFTDMTWTDALPGGGQFLPAGALGNVALSAPPPNPDPSQPDLELEQHNDDVTVNAAAPSSARWAYLLFRAPVMVAVHADDMLA